MYWATLLTNMADGDPTGYQTLMHTPVNEFYYLYRAHINRIERLTAAHKKRNRQPGA